MLKRPKITVVGSGGNVGAAVAQMVCKIIGRSCFNRFQNQM